MTYELRNGKAYLVFTDCLTDEPKRMVNGFEITWAEGPLPETNQDAYKTSIDGVYQVGRVRFNVSKYSTFVEVTDVPAPKVRKGTEIRWKYGCWEKFTRKGWQPA